MTDLRERLYISGMDPNGHELAKKYNIGFEITKYSWAKMLEDPEAYDIVSDQMKNASRFWMHAPFAEMYPTAIDEEVRKVVHNRFRQTVDMAIKHGIKQLIIHDGYYPVSYFPQWFVEQSVIFWKSFLEDIPEDMTIALENVMDPTPDMLISILDQVDDPRLGMCLDIGHANCRVSELPVYEWVEPVKHRLIHTHIHNNIGDKDIHDALGNGTIDMPRMLSLLADTNTSLTIETMKGQESIDFLIEKGFLTF